MDDTHCQCSATLLTHKSTLINTVKVCNARENPVLKFQVQISSTYQAPGSKPSARGCTAGGTGVSPVGSKFEFKSRSPGGHSSFKWRAYASWGVTSMSTCLHGQVVAVCQI
jgi:hypothetical protein